MSNTIHKRHTTHKRHTIYNNLSKKKNKNHTPKNTNIIVLKDNNVELLLLFSTLINYFILLKQCNASRYIYKQKIIDLLKEMRRNNKLIKKHTTDIDINNIYISMYKYFTQILHYLNKTVNHTHDGGFYFKNIEDKGDQPITGADVSKLLDEIQQFFYNAKYTSEGEFLGNTDTILSMFRGDVSQFKTFLQYRIFPKYYTTYPPFIRWDGIKEAIETRKWEDLPDYLLAYQSYLRSQDEYLVEKGLKDPSALQNDLYNGFFNKIAHSLDTNIQQFQQFRNKANGKFYPINVPQ